MKEIRFTDIDNIKVGNAQDLIGGTGCTVILCEKGAVAGVDVRGGSPCTRETDLLDPMNLVQEIHGVLLTGGSAFGLDAAAGIMKYLEDKQVGFDVAVTKVPIVCGAGLFDLVVGDHKSRPDKEMGYQACVNAYEEEFSTGTVGAGTGAIIGKYSGLDTAMKGGLGTYALQIGDLKVGAIVAVNCLGDVIDPTSGETVGGLLDKEKKSIVGTEQAMIDQYDNKTNLFSGNTTIGLIATNGKFNKSEINKIASMAHNGYGRSMRPAHSSFDGDTIFTLSTGDIEADINVVGLLAARTMEQAVVNAIKTATPLHGFKTYFEIKK